MACVLGFQELANHNPFIKDLDEQGYFIDFINGYLVIFGLPYLDPAGALNHGDWISPVDLSGEGVINPPSSHQAWFTGGLPHNQAGAALKLGARAEKIEVKPGLVSNFAFSFKLQDWNGQLRAYLSFEEKIQTYLDAITAPAMAAHPEA